MLIESADVETLVEKIRCYIQESALSDNAVQNLAMHYNAVGVSELSEALHDSWIRVVWAPKGLLRISG